MTLYVVQDTLPYTPIVKNLFDTDWYKILMLQFIWKYNRGDRVSFAVTNRTKRVKLPEHIDIEELAWQLDYVRTLNWDSDCFSKTFNQFDGMFEEEFLLWMLEDFKLSNYTIAERLGQFEIIFDGPNEETTMWEIYILPILNEMRINSEMAKLSSVDRDLVMAKAQVKLEGKLKKIAEHDGLKFSDFSTRRRFSFDHQLWSCRLAQAVCPENFAGSSNVYISYLLGTKPIGTNAHELPMVAAAKAAQDNSVASVALRAENIRNSQYEVLDRWGKMYPDYKIMLPDTFGTQQFLFNAPVRFLDWKGIRVDSMNPFLAAGLIMNWYKVGGVDTKTKTIIFSDGLDVDDIIKLYETCKDTFNVLFGWGTLFGNDFRDCTPDTIDISPISIVCKVLKVLDRSAVKLSDNYNKAMGDPEEVDYYKRIFGDHKLQSQEVIV